MTGSQRNFVESGSLKLIGSERAREIFSPSESSRVERGITAPCGCVPGKRDADPPHPVSISAAAIAGKVGHLLIDQACANSSTLASAVIGALSPGEDDFAANQFRVSIGLKPGRKLGHYPLGGGNVPTPHQPWRGLPYWLRLGWGQDSFRRCRGRRAASRKRKHAPFWDATTHAD